MHLITHARRLCLSLATALLMAAGAAHAQQSPLPPTLEHIRQTGILRVGYYGDEAPFAYTDADGKAIGYSIDLCSRMADELRDQLSLPKLTVQYIRLPAGVRFEHIIDGTIDIACGTTTITLERLASVAFAPSHFITESHYVALAANSLHTIDDLRGKSVAVVAGTSNTGDITRLNRERRLNLSFVVTHTQREAFDLVKQGRVSAFAMDEVLLRMFIGASGQPERYAISTQALAPPQPCGFIIRRDDPEFARAVGTALRKVYARPDMQALYDRWFNAPLPGSGVNLHMPMSPALRHQLAENEAGQQ